MELEKLTKKELIELKKAINVKIKNIETKDLLSKSKLKKDCISSLRENDKILGIRLLSGPHRLEEPEEFNPKVDIIDYCNIKSIGLREEDIRISISHPTKALGISSMISNENGEDYCLLFMDQSKSGYDAFYTLKPKTWKDDIKRKYDEHMLNIDKYHQEKKDIYAKKLASFLVAEMDKKIKEE